MYIHRPVTNTFKKLSRTQTKGVEPANRDSSQPLPRTQLCKSRIVWCINPIPAHKIISVPTCPQDENNDDVF